MRGQTRAWSGGISKMIVGAFAAGAVVGVIKKMIDASSDLSETMSKSKVVFGEHSDAMSEWAGSLASRLGQSKASALDAAAGFASMFHVLGVGETKAAGMSKHLVELASDMASFHNTSVEQALEAIGSGLRGEAEPLRKFNVLLNDATLKAEAMKMGLYDGKGALDLSTKAQAAYNVILTQSAVVNGDFENTSDGLANSLRIMKAEVTNLSAELGDNLVPAALAALGALNQMIEGVKIWAGTDDLTIQVKAAKAAEKSRMEGGIEQLRKQGTEFTAQEETILTTPGDQDSQINAREKVLEDHGLTMLEFFQAQAAFSRETTDEIKKQEDMAAKLAAKNAERQANEEKILKIEKDGAKAKEDAAFNALSLEEKRKKVLEEIAEHEFNMKHGRRADKIGIKGSQNQVESAQSSVDIIASKKKLAKVDSDIAANKKKQESEAKSLADKIAKHQAKIAKDKADNEAKINKPFEDIKAAETNVIASSLASIGGGGNVASFTSDPVLAAQIESNKILLEIKNNTKPTPAAPTVPEI